MSVLHLLSCVSSLLLCLLAFFTSRLGTHSWLLALHHLPLSLAALSVFFGDLLPGWSPESGRQAAYTLLLLSTPAGLAYTHGLTPAFGSRPQRRRRIFVALSILCTCSLVVATLLNEAGNTDAVGLAARLRGYLRYAAGLYLLSISVLVLANLERALRCREEHERWELKFLALGLAAPFATTIYFATRLLLYSSSLRDSVEVVSLVLLPSSILCLVAWRRSSGRGGVKVSQDFAFGTLTFLIVGVYLVIASAFAHWASGLLEHSVDTRVVFFIVLSTILAALLLSTRLRHRVRHWLRQNLFSGKYDYRAMWLEAAEKICASDPPEVATRALADLVHRALGALDVAVWLRSGDEGDLLWLAAARGPTPPQEGTERLGLLSQVAALGDVNDRIDLRILRAPSVVFEFCEQNGATHLVPLRSGTDTLGVLAVGPDRSGRAYQSDAREFLRVLAGHAARELHQTQLLDLQVQAKKDEAFRTFSTFLLHDLKNFATTLSMVGRNAKQHGENPEFREDALCSIVDISEKMKRLCNSLKTFGTDVVDALAPTDLNALIESVCDELAPSLALSVTRNLGEIPELDLDAEGIDRVLTNLLLNSAEAVEGSEQGQVQITTAREDESVVVRIHDNGHGIPPSFLEDRLFTPFQTTKSNGLGIGLFQSKKIVEAHGGAISIGSRPSEGTTVSLTFPVLPPSEKD